MKNWSGESEGKLGEKHAIIERQHRSFNVDRMTE